MKEFLFFVVLTGAWFPGGADAQDKVSIEKLSFRVVDAFEPNASVLGELRIPDSKRDRLPAVLIVNSSPGFDGRGAFYAEALTQAGLATLEVDMAQGRGLPVTMLHHMPHAYQSLKYLAGHARIDPARIGIMGFSWGGMLSLATNSEDLARRYGSGNLRFAAHLGLYPVCWNHQQVLAGKSKYLKPDVYKRTTGKPVHILVGDKDDYDGADGCQLFLAALPAQVRASFAVTVYPGATFAWDSRFSSAVYEPGANRGKGGTIKVNADAQIANQSRAFAVAYFGKHLGSD